MDWRETQPMPEECRVCTACDCYGCDRAGERWCLSGEEALRLRRKGLVRAVERLQAQIREIDERLAQK